MLYSGVNEVLKFHKVLEIKAHLTLTDKNGRVLKKEYWFKNDGEGDETLECLNDIVFEERYQNEEPTVTGEPSCNNRVLYIDSLKVTDLGRMVLGSLSAELFERDVVRSLIDSSFKEIDHEYETFEYEEQSITVKDNTYLYPQTEKVFVADRIDEELKNFDNEDIIWNDAFTFISTYDIKSQPEINNTQFDSCTVSFGYLIMVTCEEGEEC